ncbi:hypothetical protein [Staphylococcus xylosus]|nr:hypothetical protein [Staphylococcus xylosus]
MIDYREYAGEEKVFMINIGALDWYKVRKIVIKTVEKPLKN